MIQRLRESVWWVNLTGVNAYLVEDGETLTLVDTGFPAQAGKIAKAITTVGNSIADVERVLITHYDIDHVGGLGRLDSLDATIYIGDADKRYLTREKKPSLATRKGVFQRAFDFWWRSPTAAVEGVSHGDEIGSFTAYSTPGHTPGHTVYVSEEHSVAFLGDLVWELRGRLRPVPWIISQDPAQNIQSVTKIAELVPSFEAASIGHGVPFHEGGAERFVDCARSLKSNA